MRACVPYMLGLIETCPLGGNYVATMTKVPTSLKESASTVTASFYCWPLALTTTVSGIPKRHQHSLSNCLDRISEAGDDGMLQQVAMNSAPASDGSFEL